jgi:hypothetical protein
MVVTGDTAQLLGTAPARIATLADWLALLMPDDRERVSIRFDQRAQGRGAQDSISYLVAGPDTAPLSVSDEARAIVDHDGELHRVVGIVRVAPARLPDGLREWGQ